MGDHGALLPSALPSSFRWLVAVQVQSRFLQPSAYRDQQAADVRQKAIQGPGPLALDLLHQPIAFRLFQPLLSASLTYGQYQFSAWSLWVKQTVLSFLGLVRVRLSVLNKRCLYLPNKKCEMARNVSCSKGFQAGLIVFISSTPSEKFVQSLSVEYYEKPYKFALIRF